MKCIYFEEYKTPRGNIYFICHRPPFDEEGTMIADVSKCESCKFKK